MDEPKAEGVVKPQGVEHDIHLGQFGKLKELVDWIEVEPLEPLIPEEEVGKVAQRIGNALPFVKGSGVATTFEQLKYWEENKNIFEIAAQHRKPLVELYERIEALNAQTKWLESRLRSVQSSDVLTRRNILLRALNVLSPSENKKKGEKLQKDLASNTSDKKELVGNVEEHRSYGYDEIITKIDCKLPTFATAVALQRRGWDVKMLFNTPTHPWLLVSKVGADNKESQFYVDFFGLPGRFTSWAHILDVKNREGQIEVCHDEALRRKFIVEDEPWPMPFNEETIERFDTWYTNSAAPTHEGETT